MFSKPRRSSVRIAPGLSTGDRSVTTLGALPKSGLPKATINSETDRFCSRIKSRPLATYYIEYFWIKNSSLALSRVANEMKFNAPSGLRMIDLLLG
jgi:hypothetical protein